MVTESWVPFERYHALVVELLALKRDGFVVPTALGEPPAAPALPAAVGKAIATIASGNAPLERQLVETAWSLLKQGHGEGEVAQMILDGEPVDL